MLKPSMLLILAVLALALGAVGCRPKGDEKQPQEVPREIPSAPQDDFTPIYFPIIEKRREIRSGCKTPEKLVIKDDEALEEVRQKIYYYTFPKPDFMTVDFEKEMVIAVFMGERPTAGYSIDIVEVVEYAGKLEVQINMRKPSPGDIVGQVITSPFCIVRVRRVDKDVTFLEASRGG